MSRHTFSDDTHLTTRVPCMAWTFLLLPILLLAGSGCAPRVDYVADVNGAPLPCREAGRIGSAVREFPGSLEVRTEEAVTSVELVENSQPVETLLVAGQMPVRAIGRAVKVCNEQFLIVGAGRTPYSIVSDMRGD